MIPNVKSIRDFKAPAVVKIVSDEIDSLIQKSLRKLSGSEFVLSIYFGQNVSSQYLELSQELYRIFQAPLLRAKFIFKQNGIYKAFVLSVLMKFQIIIFRWSTNLLKNTLKTRFFSAKADNYLYDLAILINPDEKEPPSNEKAIQKFISSRRNWIPS